MDEGNDEVRGPVGGMAESTPPAPVPAPGPPPVATSARPPAPSPLVPAPATSPEDVPALTGLGVDRTGAKRSRGQSDKVGPTRLSGAWTAAIVAVVLVAAMLIFILQNETRSPYQLRVPPRSPPSGRSPALLRRDRRRHRPGLRDGAHLAVAPDRQAPHPVGGADVHGLGTAQRASCRHGHGPRPGGCRAGPVTAR